jgi:hypothetical protein
MSLQTLTLTLDGITAGDYLTWCRDPDPPALDLALRSISTDADPLGDTITAILDWNQPPPSPAVAAAAAGLPLTASVQLTAATPLNSSSRRDDEPRPQLWAPPLKRSADTASGADPARLRRVSNQRPLASQAGK